MGQEIQCRIRHNGRAFEGKAQLEGDHVLLRGRARLRIAVKDLQGVAAKGGVLHLNFPGGPVALELGDAAEKWAQKILHPPSRADKLGIKPGLTVRLDGAFDSDFLEELKDVERAAGKTKADLIFLSAPDTQALERIVKLARQLQPAGALWVVYPKGVAVIREIQVLESARATGLKDTKVVSFSSTHTALRFVIPLTAR